MFNVNGMAATLIQNNRNDEKGYYDDQDKQQVSIKVCPYDVDESVPRLPPNPQRHLHLPPSPGGGEPCLVLGWLLAMLSRAAERSEGPGPDCDQEDIRGQSLRETEPETA